MIFLQENWCRTFPRECFKYQWADLERGFGDLPPPPPLNSLEVKIIKNVKKILNGS